MSNQPAGVPLLDLQAQYAPLREEILAAITRVCDSQRFIMGPEIDAFEREIAATIEKRLSQVPDDPAWLELRAELRGALGQANERIADLTTTLGLLETRADDAARDRVRRRRAGLRVDLLDLLERGGEHGEALGALSFVPIPADVKEFVEEIGGDRFDAQDNPLTNIYNFGVHKYHRHITLSGHFFGASAMICNAAHYAAWSAAVRAAVDEAAALATQYQHQLAAEEDAVIRAKFDPRENELIELSAAERAAFVSAMEPILERYRGKLDARLFDLLKGNT